MKIERKKIKKNVARGDFSVTLSLMNKQDIKNLYILGAFEGLLKNIDIYLPSDVSLKDGEQFRARMLREMQRVNEDAEAYVERITK